jgi:hypothetical protein
MPNIIKGLIFVKLKQLAARVYTAPLLEVFYFAKPLAWFSHLSVLLPDKWLRLNRMPAHVTTFAAVLTGG